MNTGACKYCGQTFMIDIDNEDWKSADGNMDLVATRRCKCDGAIMFKQREAMAEKAKDNIDLAFYQDNPEVAELLKLAVPYLAGGAIRDLSVSKPRMKAKLAATNNRTIKVTRTDSEVKVFDE